MTANSPAGSFDTSALLFISKGNSLRDVEEDQLPYVWLENLGSGGCGIVEKVEDSNTGAIYARKLFHLKSWKKRSMKELFENEVAIIKSLGEHRHLIQVFATYTTKDKLGIILSPVAEGGDLQDFLTKFRESRSSVSESQAQISDMEIILEQAFGCLAEGLSYMHERNIRHKDIKAQNILIHRGRVVYTDFGLSFDSTLFDNSTTEGMASMTRRYAAPEVIHNNPRNSSSDVFSLGCVFLEIFSALTIDVAYLEERGDYSDSMPNIHAQLLSADTPMEFSSILKVIVAMTSEAAEVRPSAKHIAAIILRNSDFGCSECQTTAGAIDSFFIRTGDGMEGYSLRTRLVLSSSLKTNPLVEEVEDIHTGKLYALKRLSNERWYSNLQGKKFKNNRDMLRLLRHPHIVQLCAAYDQPEELVMIMKPVADQGTLREVTVSMYHATWTETVSNEHHLASQIQILEAAFGCLADGLAFIHSKSVVITDIKPEKILVHQGRVLYSGFDSAIRLHRSTESKMERELHYTKRYAAPEVLSHEKRDATTDVFSLGCVYLEILTALINTVKIGLMSVIFSQDMHAIWKDIDSSITEGKYHPLKNTIYPMIQLDPSKRSSAATVASQLSELPGFCCGDCRLSLKLRETRHVRHTINLQCTPDEQ
jgi:serine/threonine protein kinase